MGDGQNVPRQIQSGAATTTLTLTLSGLALLAAMILLFLPVLGTIFFLAGVYSGKSFPSSARQLVQIPNVGASFRGLLITVGLVVLGFGIWMQVTGRVLRIFQSDQKVTVTRRRDYGMTVVHAQDSSSHSPIESFSLRQHRAWLLHNAPFSDQVVFVVSDVHLFGSNKIMLVQKPEHYPALLNAAKTDTRVQIEDGAINIGKNVISIASGDLLLSREMGPHDENSFSFQASRYTLRVCKVDVAIFGPGHITIGIGTQGATVCK
jgi:hypothetical protein